MRSTRSVFLTVVGLLALSPAVMAQEGPKDLLERTYKAMGGFDKLAKLKATKVKGKGIMFLQANGSVAEVSFTSEGAAQLPDKFKNTLQCEINGMKITQVQTLIGDKVTSLFNGTPMDIDDNMLKEMKQQVYLEHVTSLVPLREPRFTLTALGESRVESQPALGIKVASKGHRDVSLYFDKKTALLVKAVYQGFDALAKKDVARENIYQDYAEQDGIKFARKSLILQEGKKFMQLEVTDYKALERLDDSVFKP